MQQWQQKKEPWSLAVGVELFFQLLPALMALVGKSWTILIQLVELIVLLSMETRFMSSGVKEMVPIDCKFNWQIWASFWLRVY